MAVREIIRGLLLLTLFIAPAARSRNSSASSPDVTWSAPTSDGKLLVLQAARYPELWRDGAPGFDAVMWFWTINLTRGTVTEQQIDERPIEFPRMDDRRAGMPARYGVTVGSGKLVRYDLERGTAEEKAQGCAVQGEGSHDLARIVYPIGEG